MSDLIDDQPSLEQQAKANAALAPKGRFTMTDEEIHAQCEARRNEGLGKWKVVGTDNYARESISDRLHSTYDTEEEAKAMVVHLNANSGPESSRWYRVYEPGKKLYVFEP